MLTLEELRSTVKGDEHVKAVESIPPLQCRISNASRLRWASQVMDWEDILTLARPELPGECSIEGVQRIQMKRELMRHAGLPIHDCFVLGLAKHMMNQDSSASPQNAPTRIIAVPVIPNVPSLLNSARLWFRIWLLSDNDLYFALHRLRSNLFSESTNIPLLLVSRDSHFDRQEVIQTISSGHDCDEAWITNCATVQNERKSLSVMRSEVRDRLQLVCAIEAGDDMSETIMINDRIFQMGSCFSKSSATISISSIKGLLQVALDYCDVSLNNLYKHHGTNRRRFCSLIDQAPPDRELESICNFFDAQLEGIRAINDETVYGRALVASKDLAPDTPVISLKEDNILNLYTALFASFEELPEDYPLLDPPGDPSTIRYSFSFVAALLLGGVFESAPHLPPFPDSFLENHQKLRDLIRAHKGQGFYVEEQLFLLLFLLWECDKGTKSRFAAWIDFLKGSREPDGCVDDAQHQNLLLAPPEVTEFMDLPAAQNNLDEVNDVLPRYHQWLENLLPELFPHLFKDKFGPGKAFSLAKLVWACYISESRAFESVCLPCVQFLNQVPSRSAKAEGYYRYIASTFCDSPDSHSRLPVEIDLASGPSMRTPSRQTPPLPIIPGLSYLCENEADGAESQSTARTIRLPILIGWDTRNRPYVDIMQFKVPRKVALLVPIVDFINHHPAAQCPHPGFSLSQTFSLPVKGLPYSSITPDQLESKQLAMEIIGKKQFGSRNLVLRCEGRVPKGSQIYISYGPHETWSLMRFYGFCPAPTAADSYNFDVILVGFEPPDNEPYEYQTTKHNLLRKYKIPTDHLLHKIPQTPGDVDSDHFVTDGGLKMALMCLRICLHPNVKELEHLSDHDQLSFITGQNLDPELELECATTLCDVLANLRDQYVMKRKQLDGWSNARTGDCPYWFETWGDRLRAFNDQQMALVSRNIMELDSHKRFVLKALGSRA